MNLFQRFAKVKCTVSNIFHAVRNFQRLQLSAIIESTCLYALQRCRQNDPGENMITKLKRIFPNTGNTLRDNHSICVSFAFHKRTVFNYEIGEIHHRTASNRISLVCREYSQFFCEYLLQPRHYVHQVLVGIYRRVSYMAGRKIVEQLLRTRNLCFF